jgi:photosystem II stability/assembly factor-like uncharacterized protein
MLQPPTDNIYKFLAIFGLLFFGFSIVYPFSETLEHVGEEERLDDGRVPRRADVAKDAARGQKSECFVISTPLEQHFQGADFVDSNHGWAISISDVWRTKDGGREWTRVTPPPTRAGYGLAFAEIQAMSAEEAWVLEGIALLHTTNAGNSWQVGCKLKHVDINSFRFLDLRNGWVSGDQFVEMKDGPWPYYGAIFKTSDGGATWQDAMGVGVRKSVRRLTEKGFNDAGVDAAELVPLNYSWRLQGIWPISSKEVWAAGEFLFHTVDGGRHWDITEPNPDIDGLYGIPFRIGFSGSQGWMITNAGGYAITDDGGKTWVVRSHPGSPNDLSDMLYLGLSEFWAVSAGAIYLSEDGGDSWKEMARGNYKQISFMHKDHLLMVVGRDIAECARP